MIPVVARPRPGHPWIFSNEIVSPPVVSLPPGGAVEVRDPSGRTTSVEVRGLGSTWSATARAGIYTFTRGERSVPVAVNLLDAAESDLTPPTGSETKPRAAGAASVSPFTREIGPELLLVALAVLVGEWLLFHRGT